MFRQFNVKEDGARISNTGEAYAEETSMSLRQRRYIPSVDRSILLVI